MSRLQQLETALINADRAGDEAAARQLAAAIRAERASAPNAVQSGRTGVGLIDKAAAFGRGVMDFPTLGMQDEINAAAGALPRAVIDAARGQGFDLGRAYNSLLAGERRIDQFDNANAPIARAAGQVVGAIAQPGAAAGSAARMAPRVAANLAQGAAYGFGSGEGGLENRLRSAGTAALQNAAGNEIGRGLAKGAGAVIGGIRQSPAVQGLLAEGVPLTAAQRLGGLAKRIEDVGTSMPFVGQGIEARRAEGVNAWAKARINEALAPIGVKVPTTGTVQDAVGFMQRKAGEALDNATLAMRAQIDAPFSSAIAQAKQAASSGLVSPETAKQINKLIAQRVEGRAQGGMLAGEMFRVARRDLQTTATDLARKGDGNAAEILFGLREAMDEAADRVSPPQAVDAFKRANLAYAQSVRIDAAAKLAKSAGDEASGKQAGAFTPAQLLTAVSQTDKSARGRAVAAGDALMQRNATGAQGVLPTKVGNSGTADRAMLGALATAGGASLSPMAFGEEANPYIGAGLLAAGLAGRGVYSLPAQRAINAALFSRPGVMANAGRRVGQVAAPLGLAGGGLLMQQR